MSWAVLLLKTALFVPLPLTIHTRRMQRHRIAGPRPARSHVVALMAQILLLCAFLVGFAASFSTALSRAFFIILVHRNLVHTDWVFFSVVGGLMAGGGSALQALTRGSVRWSLVLNGLFLAWSWLGMCVLLMWGPITPHEFFS
jgi:hypothetical protein